MTKRNQNVSVIMPAFNSEKYISIAIESILKQTFGDFEFVIVDDGSTDDTYKIAKSYSDKRIILVRTNVNLGNCAARNIGIEKSNGKYICVMDSDDISYSHRIEKQFDFMNKNRNFGICGSFRKIVGIEGCYKPPENKEELKVRLLGQMIFVHPSLMMRRSFLDKYKLRYDERYKYAGDYDLLVRSACHFPLTNIPEILIEYRRHRHQISSKYANEQACLANLVRLKQLKKFEITPNDAELKMHLQLMNKSPITNESDFEQLQKWANYLLERNNQTANYDSTHLANFLKSLLKYIFKQYEISKKEQHISGLNQNHKYVDFKIFNGKIQKIIKILKPKIQLNFEKEWAVLPDFITELLKLTKEIRPNTIVECGSGLSTLICGYLAKNKMANHVFSLEHNKQFYEATKNDIQIHGLEKFVTLIYAPLKQIQIEGEQWQWYDLAHIMNSIVQIDLLLVDGPPGFLQKKSRYPAFSVLKKFFHKNTVIVLDDSNRPDEQEIINRWILENPEYCASQLKTEKGMCILKQKI